MIAPRRIQLRRTKGWRMPPNTVKVDRSGPWGNPWPVGAEGPLGRCAPDAEGAVGFFCAMLDDAEMREAAGYPADLSPLRGMNLGCWCAENAPWCHADVLLKRANAEMTNAEKLAVQAAVFEAMKPFIGKSVTPENTAAMMKVLIDLSPPRAPYTVDFVAGNFVVRWSD